MLNSSYLLKQLGYFEILKYWFTFFPDSTDKVSFLKYIKPEVAEKILRLAMIESKEMLKSHRQELDQLKAVIETEVAPNLKDKMKVFMVNVAVTLARRGSWQAGCWKKHPATSRLQTPASL